MGAGKTYIGKKLALSLSLPFIDLDDFIEKQCSLSILEIFNKYGESYFRKLESDTLNIILKNNTFVLSTGGGIIESEFNRTLIKDSECNTIFMNTDWDCIWERIKNTDRPLIIGKSELEIKKLWIKRFDLYSQCANRVINNYEEIL